MTVDGPDHASLSRPMTDGEIVARWIQRGMDHLAANPEARPEFCTVDRGHQAAVALNPAAVEFFRVVTGHPYQDPGDHPRFFAVVMACYVISSFNRQHHPGPVVICVQLNRRSIEPRNPRADL